MTLPEENPERLIADAFTREVPEVAVGTVILRAIAREPGVRTKVAVVSTDPCIDPVVACVGAGEGHIQAIGRAFPNEHFDILPWAETPERFIKLALAPVNVVSCELDSAARRAVVRVRADDLGRTLGPRGVHRDLASRLVGWDLILEGVDAV